MNPVLVERLKKRLGNLRLFTSDFYGISVEAKEALAFAVLANELISGNFTNLPSVTGAQKTVPLGKIALGGRNRSNN
jgi:anhydro-N-acetylmuramic acid kinase